MFHHHIRNAEHDHFGLVMMCCHKLEYGGSEAAGDAAVFYRNDPFVLMKYLMQHFFIQRFGKAHIIMRRVNIFCPQGAYGGCYEITRVPEREKSEIPAGL